MSTPLDAQVEALQRIAKALETLVLIETRKAGGGAKVLEIAERQRHELTGRPVVELVEPENKPGPA